MPGTFDAVNLIPQRLAALGCPVSAFAAIYGKRSQGYLSQAFRGNGPLGSEEAQEMLAIIDRMEALAATVAPIPVDFSNGARIRQVLQLDSAYIHAGVLALGNQF